MKRCKRCDVFVKDDRPICPLCDSVLDGQEAEEKTYPELGYEMQKFLFVKRIFYFSLLVIGVSSVLVNYFTFHGLYWSVIVLGAIVYCCFTVNYTINNHTNLGKKVIFQAAGILILTVIIDIVTGWRGWSLRYAIPVLLLLADVALIVMMWLRPERWQGFFMCQLADCALSIIPVILAAVGVIDNMDLAIVTAVIIWLILAATVIFGGRRARLELKRRFHT